MQYENRLVEMTLLTPLTVIQSQGLTMGIWSEILLAITAAGTKGEEAITA